MQPNTNDKAQKDVAIEDNIMTGKFAENPEPRSAVFARFSKIENTLGRIGSINVLNEKIKLTEHYIQPKATTFKRELVR